MTDSSPRFPTDAITLSDTVPFLSGLVFFPEPHTGGRPPSQDARIFRQKCWEAYEKVLAANVQQGRTRLPQRREVAAAQMVARSTWYRRFRDSGCSWPPDPPLSSQKSEKNSSYET